MRYITSVLVCALFAFGTFGCGGGSSSSPGATLTGNFVGPFTTAQGQSGEMAIDITGSGTATGLIINTTTSSSSTLSGSVASTGNATLGSWSGVLSVNPSGQLSGTLTSSSGSLIFSLTNTSGGSSFAGGYNGTYTNNGSGTVQLICDASGNLTMLASGNTTTGTISSSGLTSLANGTSTGTLALQSSTLSGTLTLNSGGSVTLSLPKTE